MINPCLGQSQFSRFAQDEQVEVKDSLQAGVSAPSGTRLRILNRERGIRFLCVTVGGSPTWSLRRAASFQERR